LGYDLEFTTELILTTPDHYVDEIDFSDEYTNLSLDLVISVSDSSKGADLIMYYQDGMDTTLYPIEVLDLDSDQMYQAGKSLVDVVAADYESSTYSIKGYSSYDRVASRDYAWEWTGENVTSCYDDGPTCPIHQDRTQWNNDEYPYISNLKHDDCCDFVSQCMAKGGIPVDDGKWERFLDGDNGWSWTYVPGLVDYMTGEGYWDTSTFAAANAGNVLLWASEGHVALITLNDTVTHRYTAHTNDDHNTVFYDSATYVYYTIKTT